MTKIFASIIAAALVFNAQAYAQSKGKPEPGMDTVDSLYALCDSENPTYSTRCESFLLGVFLGLLTRQELDSIASPPLDPICYTGTLRDHEVRSIFTSWVVRTRRLVEKEEALATMPVGLAVYMALLEAFRCKKKE